MSYEMSSSQRPMTEKGGKSLEHGLHGDGHVLPGAGGSEEVKIDSKGNVLRPTPSDDSMDPLNWPKFKKHTCLAIVALYYFMFTFLTTVTVPTFAQLQDKFAASYAQINYTIAIPALGLALGHLFFSPWAYIVGRRVVMLVSCLISLAASIGSALAPGYSGYLAARFFQGFGVSPAATVGLMIIDDLYFEHERGQKIGVWTLAIDIGLVFAPVPGGFVALVSVDWPAWLTTILFGVTFFAMLFFLPETSFDRVSVISGEKQAVRYPFINYKRIEERKRTAPWSSFIRLFKMFGYFDVAIAVTYYCFTWYWWVLTVLTELPAAYAQYTVEIQGLLFLGLFVGTLFAEIFLSGTLSDKLVARLAAKNNGIRTPEQRLWLLYPAAVLTFIGITLWGWSVERNTHWIVGQIGLALFAAGIQQGNTMICSYMVDCHPELVGDSVIFYTVSLNLSAFVSPFFIVPWVDINGFGWSFTAQGLIVLVATALVVPFLQMKGPALRAKIRR